MALSSSNWLFTWLALEINILSFIPILLHNANQQQLERATKYFLIQALGSRLILIYRSRMWFEISLPVPYSTILIISLLIKLGAAPFHFWYPQVMSGSPWFTCFLLSTWQKFAPIFLLALVLRTSPLFLASGILTAFIGGLVGINQVRLRAIMSYSSLTHIGWIMALISMLYPITAILYFILYSILIIPLFIVFYYTNITYISSMRILRNILPLIGLLISLLLLVLSGLPPFAGFILKWISIYQLWSAPKLIYLLIISSLLRAYYYLNLLFSSTLAESATSITSVAYNSRFATPLIVRVLSWTFLSTLPLIIFMS